MEISLHELDERELFCILTGERGLVAQAQVQELLQRYREKYGTGGDLKTMLKRMLEEDEAFKVAGQTREKPYKVLVLNGSPHVQGCTARALEEVIRSLNERGVETELLQVGGQNLPGCKACGFCETKGRCVFDDLVNEAAEKLEQADGLLVGSPVYYSSPNGTLLSFMDRLFYSSQGGSKHMKVGACVVSCRRGGNTASFDVLNKYFSIAGMPIATSTYWNQVHGFTAEDVEKDLEGLQTMRNLGRNMAFLIKAIDEAAARHGLPKMERGAFTSFPDGK